MGKYETLAKEIVENVGGKSNIISLAHCITRLRFNLKEDDKANDEVIKNLDGVTTLVKGGGQYQIVIGGHVSDVYEDICEIIGMKQDSNIKQEKKKLSPSELFMDYASAIMGPCLSLLCACGTIKGVLSLIVLLGVLDDTSVLYMLLNAVSDCAFYFFPVFLGYSAAAKFNMTPFLGLAIGTAMLYPSIQNMENASLFGINLSGVTYASTVIPIILIIMVAAPLERMLNKVIPNVVKKFIVPTIVLLICVPLGYIIIGPIANVISNGLGTAFTSIYSFNPALCSILLGGLWQILIIFGVHTGLFVVVLVDLLTNGISYLIPILFLTTFSQTVVTFVIWLRTKDQKLKSIALPAWISAFMGITEPAIYGVTVPRIKYFVISGIAAAAGGFYAGLTSVAAYQMSGMAIIFYPMMALGGEGGSRNIINYVIAIAITIIVAAVLTFVSYKDNVEELNTTIKTKSKKIFHISAPVAGKVIPLSEMKDKAFSQGILGKGIGIDPAEGKVLAPDDGILTTFFPTYHALGITTDDGVEILIHIGMDTVRLEGKYFTPKAKQGDIVKKGQLLMEFDMESIKAAGYSLASPVIISNTDNYADITETTAKTVLGGDMLFEIINKKERMENAL